jgi:hypothetical protein
LIGGGNGQPGRFCFVVGTRSEHEALDIDAPTPSCDSSSE